MGGICASPVAAELLLLLLICCTCCCCWLFTTATGPPLTDAEGTATGAGAAGGAACDVEVEWGCEAGVEEGACNTPPVYITKL